MKTTALICLALLGCGAARAQQTQKNVQFVSPNHFELHDEKLNITYDSSTGTPRLTYQDLAQKLEFSGSQIRKMDSAELGTMLSVTTRMTVDSGSTTFTLLIPRVNLKDNNPIDVRTYGMIVVHRFSMIPAGNLGEMDTYVSHELVGTCERLTAPH